MQTPSSTESQSLDCQLAHTQLLCVTTHEWNGFECYLSGYICAIGSLTPNRDELLVLIFWMRKMKL